MMGNNRDDQHHGTIPDRIRTMAHLASDRHRPPNGIIIIILDTSWTSLAGNSQ
jgi:hypothetical protein